MFTEIKQKQLVSAYDKGAARNVKGNPNGPAEVMKLSGGHQIVIK